MTETKSLEVLALIPARGGSKGIPGKNLLTLLGKPLIAYSILHARASHLINRVIVSTDDLQIASVARDWGAETPFVRPSEFAQDLSPDIDVFRHCLNWLQENEGSNPDVVVHLRPPGPVRDVRHIDEAIQLLLSHPEADAVRSVSLAVQSPYKMWHITTEGMLNPVMTIEGMADCQSVARQTLPTVYWQNGYVDVIRPRAVLEKNSMWGDSAIPFVINEQLFEIDYPENIPAVEEALRRLEAGLPPGSSPEGERFPV